MATPPTPVATSFINSSIASGASQTTPSSVAWQTGDFVVLLVGTEGAGAETWTAPTTTGTGLTLVQQQLHASSSDCGAGCWVTTTAATAGSSGTFSVKNPHAGVLNMAVTAWVCRNSAGIGNSNISVGTSRTVSLPLSGPDSLAIWGVYDWSASTVQTASPVSTAHSAASPGPQASPNAAVVGTNYTYYSEELDDETASGTVSFGIGGSGTGPFTIIAVEVKASSGGAAVAPIRPRFPSRVPIFRAANY